MSENDQRPEGRGMTLTNGRSLKGGVKGLPGGVLPWGSGKMLTGWPVSIPLPMLKSRHPPAVSKGCCIFLIPGNGGGGPDGHFWREVNTFSPLFLLRSSIKNCNFV